MKNPKKELRAYVFTRDGNRCVDCKSTERLTIDHIVPRSKGGKNRKTNLQVLCFSCNHKKADSIPYIIPDTEAAPLFTVKHKQIATVTTPKTVGVSHPEKVMVVIPNGCINFIGKVVEYSPKDITVEGVVSGQLYIVNKKFVKPVFNQKNQQNSLQPKPLSTTPENLGTP